MRNERIFFLVIASAVIVLLLVFAPDNNNKIEDIKPYIQEVALKDEMDQCNEKELKRDFGLSPDDIEEYILYETADEDDIRRVLIVKAYDKSQAIELRRQFQISIQELKDNNPDSNEVRKSLLEDAFVLSKGRFVIVSISNNSNDIRKAFLERVH